jgi:hypothetical protein
VASLSTWECGSYLYGQQKLEVHLYPTGFEHVVAKMARVDQRLQVGSSLSPGIKDYELIKVLKANIVVDVLSHNAHCNYLPAVCLTREESST